MADNVLTTAFAYSITLFFSNWIYYFGGGGARTGEMALSPFVSSRLGPIYALWTRCLFNMGIG